jgi:DNA polymerase-1
MTDTPTSKGHYVFDIEADGLLFKDGNKSEISKVYCVVAIDVHTGEQHIFSDHAKEGKPLDEFKNFLNNAKMLSGHNVVGYDFPALKKITGWVPPSTVTIVDTMLLSQTLNYKRFRNGRHNLATWGDAFQYPKDDFAKRMEEKYGKGKAFAQWDDEMLPYCVRDVELNVKVYQYLMKEFRAYKAQKPLIATSLRIEHDVAKFCAEAELSGWKLNKPRAEMLYERMRKIMEKIEKRIEPRLGYIVKPVDKTGPKEVEFLKNGKYPMHIAKWHKIDQEDALHKRTIWGPHSRVEIIKANLGNMDSVKDWLDSIGWEPLDWNWKRIGGEFVKISPKLCSESLGKLGTDGKLIDYYYTTRSRFGILRGWIENLDENQRLHGGCFTIATPTGRARHSGIVNVPGAGATWGRAMRELFICEENNVIVGADSSGNQMRAFCHYLKNEDYTAEVIDGDVHQRNADALGCDRSTAKPFLYAFLFGAGFEKLGLILTGSRNKKVGKQKRADFTKAIPGLKELNEKLNEIYHKTDSRTPGKAWIPALDGRKIYCDSSHKALNYLLQSFEALTCKAAVAQAMKEFEEKNLDVSPLIFYHDEFEVECPANQAEEVQEIMVRAFRDAAKIYDCDILDGDGQIGNNWYDVH